MGRRGKSKHGKKKPDSGLNNNNNDTLSHQEVSQQPVATKEESKENNISYYMSLVSPNIASSSEQKDVTVATCTDTNTVPSNSLITSAAVMNSRSEASNTVENADNKRGPTPRLDETKTHRLPTPTFPDGKKTADTKPSVSKENMIVFFDVIEKAAVLLKSGNGNELLTILQKLMPVMEDADEKKVKATFRMLDGLLSSTNNCNLDYITYVEEHIKSIIIPEGLRALFVPNDVIKENAGLLGMGAFGMVSRGKLVKPGRSAVTVAIKAATDTRFNSMLMKEASIMSQLDHDVILKVLAFTIDGDSTKIVMELMELGDIFDAIIEERVVLSDADLLTIIHEVCSGMEYLTGRGYIHRDLKCQNVFLNKKKQCKIGDFGICRYVGDSGGVYIENNMRVNGIHVAPESEQSYRFTRKSDVWAMGILIWDLYTINIIWRNTRDHFKLSLKMSQMRTMFSNIGQLQQPRNCPIGLQEYVAREILNRNPSKRPEFKDIKKKILNIIRK